MAKKRCEKKNYTIPETPKYICKKCERASTKEEKLCKPQKLK
jgi:hypothetical protein